MTIVACRLPICADQINFYLHFYLSSFLQFYIWVYMYVFSLPINIENYFSIFGTKAYNLLICQQLKMKTCKVIKP